MSRTIIGLDLDREFSQISYYSERNMEPETVSIMENQDKYLIPTPQDLFSVIEEAMDLGVMSLANFLKTCISFVRTATEMQQVYMMVTMKEICAPWIEAVKNACEMLGMNRENVWLQTHRESLFCYTLNQRRDLWSHKVALFEYEESKISSYMLETDYGTRPALVTVTPGEVLSLENRKRIGGEEWNRKRDELFLELIRRIFAESNVSSTFLVGDSFDKTWAVNSLSFLCRKRHVFQGRNLYTKGACFGACQHLGIIKTLDGFLYKSEDMVEYNISMEMEIRGKLTNYLLIGAGVNWFDAEYTCEFMLDETEEIVIYAKSMLGGPVSSYTIELKNLPKRPARTTRLQMKAAFTAADRCRITLRDLGFGEFFPPSGLSWESTLKLS